MGSMLDSPLVKKFHSHGFFIDHLIKWNIDGLPAWIEMQNAINKQPSYERIVGLDTEWFMQNPLAAVQIATQTHCFVFHLPSLPKRQLPKEVSDFLSRSDIVMCGVAISGDAKLLNNQLNCLPHALMSVEEYVSLLFPRYMGQHSLKGLFESLVGGTMPLKVKSITRSNWEKSLSVEQRQYAADDAVASFQIGKLLAIEAATQNKWSRDSVDVDFVNWIKSTQIEAKNEFKRMTSLKSTLKLISEGQKNIKFMKRAKIMEGPEVNILSKDGLFLSVCSQFQAALLTADKSTATILRKDGKVIKKIQLLIEHEKKSRFCMFTVFHLSCPSVCPFAHSPAELERLDKKERSCCICASDENIKLFPIIPVPAEALLPEWYRKASKPQYLPLCPLCQFGVEEKVYHEMDSMIEEAEKLDSSITRQSISKTLAYQSILSNPKNARSLRNEQLKDMHDHLSKYVFFSPLPEDQSTLQKMIVSLSRKIVQRSLGALAMKALAGDDLEETNRFFDRWKNIFLSNLRISSEHFVTQEAWNAMKTPKAT